VFDAIMAAAPSVGGRLAGYHALNSLRMEKGYRHWGHDISDEDTPLQAGLGFAVAMNKPGGFIGHAALLAQKDAGLTRRLVQFALVDDQALLYHNEPIWRDNKIVGRISSGMFGHHLGKSLGMGYVECAQQGEPADAILSGHYEVEVAGVRITATPSLAPLYDPTSARVKSAD